MARERIIKGAVGSRGSIEKEILLSVTKSGYGAGNTQRWSTTIRFADGSWKKASDTEYVAIDVDWEDHRVYFVSSTKQNGFKLTGNKGVRTITFTTKNKERWKAYEGEYSLVKDVVSGDYYIDLKKKAITKNINE